MCDIFTKSDVQTLFEKKSVLFLGDSIMRNIYKDLVWMTSFDTDGQYTPNIHYRNKGEKSFCGDNLINNSELTVGRDYEEERDFYIKELDLQYSFIFITRCFSGHLKKLLDNYPKRFGSYPDMMIINSVIHPIYCNTSLNLYDFSTD